jgi:hypothetical protein
MQELLSTMIGKKIDAFCGGASSVSGEVIKVDQGVLHLKDDNDQICYVAIDKVVAVWEKRDNDHHAGFMSKS